MPFVRMPTLKEKKFADEYLRTGNKVQSAKVAYGSKNYHSASHLAYVVSRRPPVQTYIQQRMAEEGITVNRIGKAWRKLLDKASEDSTIRTMSPGDAINVLKEVSKIQDIYPAEKKKIEQTKLTMKYDKMDEKELLEVLKQQSTEIASFSRLLKGNIQNAEVVQ